MAETRTTRPSPDALLEEALRETRGRLKIFLGAAPGVGKTYAMLASAEAKRDDGVDVVIGVVETHGRAETQALVRGFEVIPRRRIDYKGRMLEEMDLDAILARSPQLALVDELAHTNAPGSRHPKRYLDVEELLAAGIDVYTTAQHPARREPQRRRRPDHPHPRPRDRAGLDHRPRRRHRGHRHHPRRPDPAPEGGQGLRPRDRRAARSSTTSPPATSPRCASSRCAAPPSASTPSSSPTCRPTPSPAPGRPASASSSASARTRRAAGLVRYAKRLADRLHAPWTALTIETAAHRRAARGGARPHRRHPAPRRTPRRRGPDPARRRPHHRRRRARLRARAQRHPDRHRQVHPLALVRDAARLGRPRPRAPRRRHQRPRHRRRRGRGRPDPVEDRPAPAPPPAASTCAPTPSRSLAVAAAFALAKLIEPLVGIESLDLVFLTAVVGVAVRFGLGPSLLAVAAGSLIYNFFFLPPTYTFTIAEPDQRRGARASSPSSRSSSRTSPPRCAARRRPRRPAPAPPRRSTPSAASSPASPPSTTCSGPPPTRSPRSSTSRSCCSCPTPTAASRSAPAIRPRTRSTPPTSPPRNGPSRTTAPPAAAPTPCPARGASSCRSRTGRGAVGVVGLDTEHPGPLLTPEQRRLFDALADQAAVAIERVNLVEDVETAMRAAEADRLRQALLTSISHDLRTPLAAIIGAAGTLRDFPEDLDRGGPRRAPRHRSGRGRAPQPLHRQPPRHDPARVRRRSRRARAAHDLGEIVGSALQRAGRVLADAPRRRSTSPTTCRWSRSTRCSSSRCSSTCSTTPRNTRPQAPPSASRRGRPRPAASSLQRPRRGRRASRRTSSSASSTSSTASRRATASAPAPASASRSAAASSRPWAARSPPATAPTAPAPSSPSPCRPPADARAGARRMTAPAVRILVVDDEPPIRRLLRTSLAAQGYDVIEAGDRRRGRAPARRPPISCILDLGLPDIAGQELLAPLARRRQRRAGRHPLQPRRRGRHRRGAGARRRRLRDEALRHARARRPPPHRAAPPPAD